MLVTTEDMNHIVGEVWDAVFGLAISPTGPALFAGPVITATVRLHGDHDASVVVRCSNDLAVQMAARAFDLEPPALEPDDLLDTVGEVANILAGNVKSMLGGECSLSVPTATEGHDTGVEAVDGHVVQDDHFVCNGGHVAITSTRAEI